jgi:hypothetical protein
MLSKSVSGRFFGKKVRPVLRQHRTKITRSRAGGRGAPPMPPRGTALTDGHLADLATAYPRRKYNGRISKDCGVPAFFMNEGVTSISLPSGATARAYTRRHSFNLCPTAARAISGARWPAARRRHSRAAWRQSDRPHGRAAAAEHERLTGSRRPPRMLCLPH